MRIDLPASVFAVLQQSASDTGVQAGTPGVRTHTFMALLTEMQGHVPALTKSAATQVQAIAPFSTGTAPTEGIPLPAAEAAAQVQATAFPVAAEAATQVASAPVAAAGQDPVFPVSVDTVEGDTAERGGAAELALSAGTPSQAQVARFVPLARIAIQGQEKQSQANEPAVAAKTEAHVQAAVSGPRCGSKAQPGEAVNSPWVPWTEEELSELAADGVPESEIQNIREQTFPEVAAERWMRIIAPFLNEAALPDAKADYIAAGRAKCPFLDWVLSGKDPVEYFRQPGKLSPPLHQVTDCSDNPLLTTLTSPVTVTAVPQDLTVAEPGRAPSPRPSTLPIFASSGRELKPAIMAANLPLAVHDSLETRTSEFAQGQVQVPDAATAVAATGAAANGSGTESADAAQRRGPDNLAPAGPHRDTSDSRPQLTTMRNIETAAQSNALHDETDAPTVGAVIASGLREVVEAPQRVRQPADFKTDFAAAAGHAAAADLRQTDATKRPAAEARAVPQDPESFMSELAERIQVQVRQGGNDIRIQLKPANLGHVEIAAQTGREGIVARIVTESSAVKQYLENNLHVLEQALVDQGLRMDRIDVVAQSYLGTRQSHAQSDGHYPAPGQQPESGGRVADSPLAAEEALTDSALRPAIGPNSTFHTVA